MAKRRKRTKKVAKKVTKRAVGRPRKSAPTATLGVAQHISAALNELYAQRASVDGQIAALERTLSELGAFTPARRGPGRPPGSGSTASSGRGRRGPRAGSLKEYIENVMSGKGVMGVKDITEAVVSTGYKSKNKTLGKSVGIALVQMPNVKKVARGQFQLR